VQFPALLTIIRLLVISKLDYCNSVLAGVHGVLRRIQSLPGCSLYRKNAVTHVLNPRVTVAQSTVPIVRVDVQSYSPQSTLLPRWNPLCPPRHHLRLANARFSISSICNKSPELSATFWLHHCTLVFFWLLCIACHSSCMEWLLVWACSLSSRCSAAVWCVHGARTLDLRSSRISRATASCTIIIGLLFANNNRNNNYLKYYKNKILYW